MLCSETQALGARQRSTDFLVIVMRPWQLGRMRSQHSGSQNFIFDHSINTDTPMRGEITDDVWCACVISHVRFNTLYLYRHTGAMCHDRSSAHQFGLPPAAARARRRPPPLPPPAVARARRAPQRQHGRLQVGRSWRSLSDLELSKEPLKIADQKLDKAYGASCFTQLSLLAE